MLLLILSKSSSWLNGLLRSFLDGQSTQTLQSSFILMQVSGGVEPPDLHGFELCLSFHGSSVRPTS
jgi:hypothetical protein